jgi:mannose-6-phosphate isomerase-like protein (cupin superfamily)
MDTNLLGGIGLTHLRVYHNVPGPDGVHGGCAHIHALTPEAYFGLSGEGAIELHDRKVGLVRQKITKGTFVQFPPGTLHRSISTDQLEVMAIMGNGGLPERGDARIYFGRDVDETPGEYEKLRDLVQTGLDGALRRRDFSSLAYARLIKLWRKDKLAYFAELDRFDQVHRESIADKSGKFREAIENGPVRSGQLALDNLDTLVDTSVVGRGAISMREVTEKEQVFGMCGLLRQIDDLEVMPLGTVESELT